MTFGDGWIDMFFIDTSPLVKEYFEEAWAQNAGGLTSSNAFADLLELETDLADSKALWKIVVGHHPVRSNGNHGEEDGLREILEPTLSKYKVNLYLNGHDHNL